MKPKVVLFFVGLAIIIMGAAPLIANFIPAAAAWLENLPKAGSVIYQIVLTVIGVIAFRYSVMTPGSGKATKADLLKALGK